MRIFWLIASPTHSRACSVVATTVVAWISGSSTHVRAFFETGSRSAWTFDIAISGVALDKRMVTWRSGNEGYDRKDGNEDSDESHVEMICCIRTASGVCMKKGSCVVSKGFGWCNKREHDWGRLEEDSSEGFLGELSLLYRNMRGYWPNHRHHNRALSKFSGTYYAGLVEEFHYT